MGSEVCANELMNEENLSGNSISISKVPDEICGFVEAKIVAQSSKPAGNQRPSIGPVTPDSNREHGEQNHDFSSPLTVVSSPPYAPCSNSAPSNCPTSPDGNSLETPKETLFDSFAPGPDKFMLAPQQRKYREESRNHVVRRLDFMCATNLVRDFSHESGIDTFSDEERLFDIVYGTILDAIFSEQTKELVAKFPTRGSDLQGLRTPKSAPLLSGFTETCPGAPIKSTSKSRNIDKEICRKLEF